MAEQRDAVLVTRPLPAAAGTASRVAAMGFRPVIAPVLRIETLSADLPDPAGLRAVLAASSNAVEAIPPAWHGVPLLAVGAATARKAREAGFASAESADGDAAALAALAARRFPPEGPPLLLASGVGQGEALAADLAARGFSVIRRAVYAAVPASRLPDAAAEALRGGRLRAGLFFSAETARAFVRLAVAANLESGLCEAEALAIGGPAAVALERLPWRRIRTAAQPTQDGILALLR